MYIAKFTATLFGQIVHKVERGIVEQVRASNFEYKAESSFYILLTILQMWNLWGMELKVKVLKPIYSMI